MEEEVPRILQYAQGYSTFVFLGMWMIYFIKSFLGRRRVNLYDAKVLKLEEDCKSFKDNENIRSAIIIDLKARLDDIEKSPFFKRKTA